MSKGVTLKKYTDNIPNEDSFAVDKDFIAVSDGAGGCGVFASEWSRYLVDKLPRNSPIESFVELDNWVEDICEQFYDEYENKAKNYDCVFQHIFHKQGSFATIAAIWRVTDKLCKWVTYGDSVVFHYDISKNELHHSFTKLKDFANPPYLIGFVDQLTSQGFNAGRFVLDDNSIVFAASDALSHYILMMYMVSKRDEYEEEINDILSLKDSTSQMLGLALCIDHIDFYNDVISLFQRCASNLELFENTVKGLHEKGLLDIDDYTLTML